MKRLKLNLDELSRELEMLDAEYLRGLKGGYGEYGGYNSWEELFAAMQNGYIPPDGTYYPGGDPSGTGGDYGNYNGYGGYNNQWPGGYPPGTDGEYGNYNPGGEYGGYFDYGGYGVPWVRDQSGHIVATRTSTAPFLYTVYGDKVIMEEYEISIIGGGSIKAYKAVAAYHDDSSMLDYVTADERSNCMGYALTGGEYTFIDNPYTSADEGKLTRSTITGLLGFEECSKEEATLVVIYSGPEAGADVTHAGIINPDGTYSAKGGGSAEPIRTGMTEAEFYQPYQQVGDHHIDYYPESDPESRIVYYKQSF